MLHSRLPSPKLNNNRQSSFTPNPLTKSKSSASFAQMVSKMEIFSKNVTSSNQQSKFSKRVQSAFKKKYDDISNPTLPKVISQKGKLCLGKLARPGVILSTQARRNPWAEPNPINQAIINRKGLMEMINMGMLPKNSDFTELLNHRYEEVKQKQNQLVIEKQQKQQHGGFFPTNPNLIEQRPTTNQVQKQSRPSRIQKQESQEIRETVNESHTDKKIRKKSKKSKSKKQALIFQLPEEPIILQINNQKVEKNQKYFEHLKKVRKTGDEVIMKMFIMKVQQFAAKYGLKKFQFKVVMNQIKKISDQVIYENILNAKALGIHVAIRGNIKRRVNDVVKMVTTRYKFKKSRRDLLKIQKIKRYYKIKKEYEMMTKKRCDLLKFKLGSFAQRQRRFVEEATEKLGTNQKFRVHIHMICKSGKTYEEEQSYYKLQHRHNIELTRIFNSQPQYLLILLPEEVDLSPWLNLMKKIRQYHPVIEPIFTSLKGYNIRTHDSLYYGIDKQAVSRVKKICGKSQSVCLFNGDFSSTLVDISEVFNAKMFGSSFWKPHLDKLLQQDNEQLQIQKQKEMLLNFSERYASMTPQNASIRLSEAFQPQIQVKFAIPSGIRQSSEVQSMRQIPRTEAQIKHMFQKLRRKQIRSFLLNGEYFSNKLSIKNQIFLQFGCLTPHSAIFSPNTSQKQMIKRLTSTILQHKNVNKWVFKLGNDAKFSRGLAFLETDSLKILKQKKKKNQITENDLVEVSNIMKVILIDKLEIPQNLLQDSQQFLTNFQQLGGYVEAVITDVTSQCIFGKITAVGEFELLGTYTKIYTDEIVNCAATHPSHMITQKHINDVKELSEKMYKIHQILGYVTFEMLVDRKGRKNYFIDVRLSLDQYSSFYFMYKAILSNLRKPIQSLKLLRKKSEKKVVIPKDPKTQILKNSLIKSEFAKYKKNEISFKDAENENQNEKESENVQNLQRQIIYIPFIDNNGNMFNSFSEFQQAGLAKSVKMLDFQEVQGVQFLYLNLKEQKPDVLSLVAFSESEKKALKYTLDGLNFLAESGDRANKLDKKVQRRAYDCLYIHDIIWKFRQLKKSKDMPTQQNQSMEMQ